MMSSFYIIFFLFLLPIGIKFFFLKYYFKNLIFKKNCNENYGVFNEDVINYEYEIKTCRNHACNKV